MTETEQIAIADRWFEALKHGNLQRIVSLYSKIQLSFHPTLWNEHIRDHKRVHEYFVEFLSKDPSIDSHTGTLFSLNERSFLYTGTMNLSISSTRGKEASLVARFSIIWVRENDNEWRIIHHHNSVVPVDESTTAKH